jgi:DNA-binding transcriptional MerR regulator
MASATKAEGAFLTIGELADELGLPHHILRYWETRFPQLKPLQRAGNRRYYRPEDAQLAREINRLLYQDGYTVKGVQKLLGIKPVPDSIAPARTEQAVEAILPIVAPEPAVPAPFVTVPDAVAPEFQPEDIIAPLRAIRARLSSALSELEVLA